MTTEQGARLGKVSSYDVDESAGSIQCYRIGGFLAQLRGQTVEFPPSAIHHFGWDAIIVENAVGASHPRAAKAIEEEPGRESSPRG